MNAWIIAPVFGIYKDFSEKMFYKFGTVRTASWHRPGMKDEYGKSHFVWLAMTGAHVRLRERLRLPLMSESAFISVRVTPRSSEDAVIGWQDNVLRVRLKAPPVEGRANEALCRFLASLLDVPARDIEVVTGGTARTKRLRILGMTTAEVERKLGR